MEGIDTVYTNAVAVGWIPFVVCIITVTLFSWCYIAYFKHYRDSDLWVNFVATTSLVFALLILALVPVDVFVASFMKNQNGTFKPWAADIAVRTDIENTVLVGYYVLFATCMFFCFFLLPLAYFFYEEKDDAVPEQKCTTRCCSALKYVMVFLFIAALLIVVGFVIPLKDAPVSNSTSWNELQYLLDELKKNKGEDIISFLLCILSAIGMFLVCGYTAVGMSFFPIKLFRESPKRMQLADIEERQRVIRNHIQTLHQNHGQGAPNRNIEDTLQQLEREDALLSRWERQMTSVTHLCLEWCKHICYPFAILIGILFLIVGVIVFVSLLLSNIDKALHSASSAGYVLPKRSLANPTDMLLVILQRVFPLDYVFYGIIVVVLIAASLSGMNRLSFHCCCIQYFAVKPRRTRPQGLILMCATLLYTILGINILMFNLSPMYTMYGSQMYYKNVTDHSQKNQTLQLVHCDTDASHGECTLTRISLLLVRYFYKASYFGAFYYWAIWMFLAVILFGSVLSVFCFDSKIFNSAQEDDELEESDDEDTERAQPSSSNNSVNGRYQATSSETTPLLSARA